MDKLFTNPNGKYAYCSLHAGHPVFHAFYWDFRKRYGLIPGCSDNQRIEFEKLVWDYWRWAYHEYDPRAPKIPDLQPYGIHISNRFMGWQEENFNLFLLNKLRLEKALPQFAKRYEKELRELADERLKWLAGTYQPPQKN